MTDDHKALRKRLMQWHRNKQKSIAIVDLLDSTYQTFRNKVCTRLEKDLDFYDAIKEANLEELQKLDMIILEFKLNI